MYRFIDFVCTNLLIYTHVYWVSFLIAHHSLTILQIYDTCLPKIFDTHPLDTCKILDMSQGLAPEWASSTIFCRVESGKGLPPTNTPPS